jgi:hypothetical protein
MLNACRRQPSFFFNLLEQENERNPDPSPQTRFQLDSGATCNIITANVLKESELQKTNQILTMFNNKTIKPIGKCKLKLVNPKNNEKFIAEFVVIKDEILTPLLGNKAVQFPWFHNYYQA